jgi:hypothetical protein
MGWVSYAVLGVVAFCIFGYVIARIEPLWRFTTWLGGTVLVQGKVAIIVALVLAWLEYSDRAAVLCNGLAALLKR